MPDNYTNFCCPIHAKKSLITYENNRKPRVNVRTKISRSKN